LSWLKRPSPFWLFVFAAFCAATLPPQLPAMTFRIVTLTNLRPMTATSVLTGNIVIVLTFVVAVVAVVDHQRS
jgi:hypothetical protein